MNVAEQQERTFWRVVELVGPTVKHYLDDLYWHDRIMFAQNEGVPFLLAARECGTHTILLRPIEDYPAKGETEPFLFGRADRRKLVTETLSMAEAVTSPYNSGKQWIYCDGADMREVSPMEFIEIAKQYCLDILEQWRNED